MADLNSAFDLASDEERKQLMRKTHGIFQLKILNVGKQALWTVDTRTTGTVYKGLAKDKADVILILSDDVFMQLAEGKLDSQKAFMNGKLKIKGNMLLAASLDGLVRFAKGGKAKL